MLYPYKDAVIYCIVEYVSQYFFSIAHCLINYIVLLLISKLKSGQIIRIKPSSLTTYRRHVKETQGLKTLWI